MHNIANYLCVKLISNYNKQNTYEMRIFFRIFGLASTQNKGGRQTCGGLIAITAISVKVWAQ